MENTEILNNISWFVYLFSAVLFVVGLQFMNSPKTARKGNFISITGMGIAVVMALFHSLAEGFASYYALLALGMGIILGAVVGVLSARTIKMTAMPQLVSLFNTVGGGAAALIAINDALTSKIAGVATGAAGDSSILEPETFSPYIQEQIEQNGAVEVIVTYANTPYGAAITAARKLDSLVSAASSNEVATWVTIVLGIVIGCITFTGSLVAAGKLQGIISGKAVKIPAKLVIDIVCLLGILVGASLLITNSDLGFGDYVLSLPVWGIVLIIAVLALILGVTFALPIGGADMPVVISILNACTGTAVAMAGFVINNVIMIVAGALVGAAGAILSQLMAKAMNRSLLSVLGGGFGGGSSAEIDDAAGADVVLKETSADDLAVRLAYASKVIIVPGYGLAVAGAQHEIADLTKLLEGKGVDVKFAIHPVAGRMPGHMNVLLAEANIPYEQILDLEDVNPEFATADVALVVGANDVTNPAARRQGSPISGMPILDVDAAKSAVVIKRGRGKGYAGIENELYGLPSTTMLYGDAKKVTADVIAAVKEL